MPFELLTPTSATLASVTPRTELHGDDKVLAVSLGLRFFATTASPQDARLIAEAMNALSTPPAASTSAQGLKRAMELAKGQAGVWIEWSVAEAAIAAIAATQAPAVPATDARAEPSDAQIEAMAEAFDRAAIIHDEWGENKYVENTEDALRAAFAALAAATHTDGGKQA